MIAAAQMGPVHLRVTRDDVHRGVIPHPEEPR